MKLFSVVALVVALSLLLAGARIADARVVTRSEAVSGPAFAGDAIVFIGVGPTGKFALMRVGADGAFLRLAPFPNGPGETIADENDLFLAGTISTGEVEGSTSVVAASSWKFTADRYYGTSPTEQTFFLGTPSAVTAQPVSCVIESDAAHLDVEGDRVATAGNGCRVTVTNTATGERRTAGVTRGGLVRLAGRYVAYHNSARDIEVWDLETGFVAYRVGGSDTSWDFALQGDGTLVRYRGVSEDCNRIEWYSIAEPRAHALAACDGDAVHGIENDRVVLERSGRLGVSDLAGGFSPLSVPEQPAGRVDVFGGRIAYATRGCSPDTGTIYDIGLDDPPAARVATPICEAVPGRAAQLVRRGWELPVRCLNGCRASVRIEWRSKGRWVGTVSKRVELNANVGMRLTIRSPKSERPRFGKRRTLKGRAVVKVQQAGDATRARSFTYPLTLRR
jgi:hypothetical protein